MQEEHALREAQTRVGNLERRKDDHKIAPEVMSVICSMLYSILGVETKKHVLAKNARDDMKKMRSAVEELRKMEVNMRPARMDVSSVQQRDPDEYTHAEWVAWQDTGCPEEDPLQAADDRVSLDALGKV